MPTWNETLFGRPQRNLTAETNGATVRSRNTDGLLGQRHRFRGQENVVGVSWDMVNSTFGKFLDFHEFELQLGSLWFDIDLPFPGYGTCKARFVEGNFTFHYVESRHWLVAAQLEIKDPVLLTEVELDTVLAGGVDDTSEDYLMVDDDSPMCFYNGEYGNFDDLILVRI